MADFRDRVDLDTDQAEAALKRLGDEAKRFGDRGAAGAERFQQGVEGSKKETASLLAQITKLNKRADFAEAKAASEEYRASLRRLKTAQAKLRDQTKRSSQATEKFSKDLAQIKAAGVAAAAAFAIREVTQAMDALVESASRGAALKDLDRAFAAMGGSAKEMTALRDAVDGTVSDAQLMRMRNMAVALGIASESVDDLAKIAKTSALATGQDINFLFDSVVTGTARRSTKILDNLGLNAAAIRGELARVGATIEDASSEQFLAAIKASAATMENVGALKAQADAYGQISAGLENARAGLDRFADSTLRDSGALETVTGAGRRFQSFLARNEKVLQRIADGAATALADKFDTLTNAAIGLGEAYVLLNTDVGETETSVWDILDAINPLEAAKIGWANATDTVTWALDSAGDPMAQFEARTLSMALAVEETNRVLREQATALHDGRRALQAQEDVARRKAEAERLAKAQLDQAAADQARMMRALQNEAAAQEKAAAAASKHAEELERLAKAKRQAFLGATRGAGRGGEALAGAGGSFADLVFGAQGEGFAGRSGGLFGGGAASPTGDALAGGFGAATDAAGTFVGTMRDAASRYADEAERIKKTNEDLAKSVQASLGDAFANTFDAILNGTGSLRERMAGIIGGLLSSLATAFGAWAVTEGNLLAGNPFLAAATVGAMQVAARAVSSFGDRGGGTAAQPNIEPIQRAIETAKDREAAGSSTVVNIYGLPSEMFEVVEGEARRRGLPQRAAV